MKEGKSVEYYTYYSPANLSVRIDETTLKFFGREPDSEGKFCSAQIKILPNGDKIKDNVERFSSDERKIIWSSDIDDFVNIRLNGFGQVTKSEILTIYEVSDILNVSKEQVLRYVEIGALYPIRKEQGVTLFIKSDIKSYLYQNLERVQKKLNRLNNYKGCEDHENHVLYF